MNVTRKTYIHRRADLWNGQCGGQDKFLMKFLRHFLLLTTIKPPEIQIQIRIIGQLIKHLKSKHLDPKHLDPKHLEPKYLETKYL